LDLKTKKGKDLLIELKKKQNIKEVKIAIIKALVEHRE